MNKKVSTILTLGLFLGGSLLSVTNAESLSDFVDANAKLDKISTTTKYFLKVGDQYLYSSVKSKAINYEFKDLNEEVDDLAALDNYLWYVSKNPQIDGTIGYTLKNAETGELIRIKSDGTDLVKTSDTSAADYKSGKTYFYWGNKTQDLTADKGYTSASLQVAGITNEIYLDDNTTTDVFDVTSTKANASTIELVPQVIGVDVDDEELNDLYNSVGFNFTLGKDYESVENIFDGEAVKAIKVTSDVKVDEGRSFPAGTYFAVSTPAGAYPTEDNTNLTGDKLNDAQLAYLMDCEFIALSATDHMSYDAETLKKGEGYMLTTESGRDLNKYTVTGDDAEAGKMSNGETISVWNACFKASRKPGTQTYALTIPKARVSVSGSHVDVTDLQLNVFPVYGGGGYLATDKTDKADDVKFIFSFEESNVVKATELLKENGAAIYNIKFKTTGNEQSENNKYLFASAYSTTLYAKGVVLTNENNPEFQFVITNVDANNNITFTNRANHDAKFIAQLFDEGNGVYSLALVDGQQTKTATILNVDNEGNVTDKKSNGTTNMAKLHRNKIVLETPESTDMFNGTWTVASNEKVTISFARDNDPTSNKVYPIVKWNESNKSYYIPTSEEMQAAEVSDASQWQLVRTSNKPTYKTQTYAFKVVNGETETVKYMSLGDTIAYYTYKIQLVADGMAQEQYLAKNGNSYELKSKNSNGTNFVIKDNVDGSVSIMNSYATNQYLSIADYEDGNIHDLDYYIEKAMEAATAVQTSEATDIKTYLLSEAPEVSWPATEGHISWQGELGNYISMDENRDGIVVNDSEEVYYLNVTDKKEVVPSFYISRGTGADDRMFLFNPGDSIDYYVGEGKYDKTYEWKQETKKVIFKAAQLNETSDTLTTNIKGEVAKLAMKSDNKGTQGGLNRFKFQIIEAADADAEGLYYIRQTNAGENENYLSSWNEKLTWSGKTDAMLFHIEGAAAPTANEGVSNAAGKNVVISTILGQIVANEVLTSDNATISVPAGIAIVSVDGEEAVKVSVR